MGTHPLIKRDTKQLVLTNLRICFDSYDRHECRNQQSCLTSGMHRTRKPRETINCSQTLSNGKKGKMLFIKLQMVCTFIGWAKC